jgi:threonine-phosphate decarboxylase
MIYGHGDDTYQYEGKVKMNFSTNIYSKANLASLKIYLSQRMDAIMSYPQPEASRLEKLIADSLEINPNRVLVTNGATEAIYLIAQLYRNYYSIIPQPTFSEYADASLIFNHTISYHNNPEMDLLPENRVYWLCNPNNPTGNVIIKELVNSVIRHHHQYVFVLDQSYEDYTLKEMLHPADMTDCHNLIMLYSLSKKYCIPGLRLGYLVASPIIIDRLRQLRQPWTVNALAIEAGEFLVKTQFKAIPNLKDYLDEAQRLQKELNNIPGIMMMDTFTNFMLGNIEYCTTRELKTWLVDHYGILIRDASNFYGLDDHCFRVASLSREENNVLIAAIKDFISLCG